MDPSLGAISVGLLFQGIVLSWINKIERKCPCSADWRRDYIKYFSIAMIVYGIIAALILGFLFVFLGSGAIFSLKTSTQR